MKISLPDREKNINGVLRDITKFGENHWQIKITTEISNLRNMYLTLDDEEIAFLKEWIEKEEAQKPK